MRYFDAARSYGLAEEFLGSWLAARGLGRADVTVGSKWGYTYTAGWRVDAEVNEVKDLSIETLRRQEGESHVLLGDALALYQIHSATIESGVLEDAAVLDELARLRASGLRIGFTSTGPRQSETIERAVATGHFDAVQATFNLLDRSAGPALAAARGAGLGVIVKEAVANGRLTGRGDVPELLAAAAQLGVTADALALAFVLAQPWVDVALSGASTVPMLLSNLAALDVPFDQEVDARLAGVARVAGRVLGAPRSTALELEPAPVALRTGAKAYANPRKRQSRSRRRSGEWVGGWASWVGGWASGSAVGQGRRAVSAPAQGLTEARIDAVEPLAGHGWSFLPTAGRKETKSAAEPDGNRRPPSVDQPLLQAPDGQRHSSSAQASSTATWTMSPLEKCCSDTSRTSATQ